MRPLYSETSRRNNSLNLIRLLLAVLVVFSHSFPLSQGKSVHGEPLSFLTRHQSDGGAIAVDLFFIISGLLITRSWVSSRSSKDYFLKRILRIYPGFVVAMVVSLVVAAICTPSAVEFFQKLHKAEFAESLIILDYRVLDSSTIFPSNPYPYAANNSLWSIGREFFCYVIIAVSGIIGVLRRRWLFTSAACLLYLLYAWDLYHYSLDFQSPLRCLTCFAVGALFYLYREHVPSHPVLLGVSLLTLVIGCLIPPFFRILFPVPGAYALFYFAFNSRGVATRIGSKNDLSYGVYLYAFPLQQVLVYSLGIRNPYLLFVLAAPAAALFAAMSWFFVERPFLSIKSKRTQSAATHPVLARDAPA